MTRKSPTRLLQQRWSVELAATVAKRLIGNRTKLDFRPVAFSDVELIVDGDASFVDLRGFPLDRICLVDLEKVDLSYAEPNVPGVRVRADIVDCRAKNCRFSQMKKLNFLSGTYSDCDFSQIHAFALSGRFERCCFANSIFKEGHITDESMFVDCDFAACNFKRVQMSRVKFVKCSFGDSSWGRGSIVASTFHECNCRDVNFADTLRSPKTGFIDCELTGANFDEYMMVFGEKIPTITDK